VLEKVVFIESEPFGLDADRHCRYDIGWVSMIANIGYKMYEQLAEAKTAT
jgi:hypothetical protein